MTKYGLHTKIFLGVDLSIVYQNRRPKYLTKVNVLISHRI